MVAGIITRLETGLKKATNAPSMYCGRSVFFALLILLLIVILIPELSVVEL